MKRQLGCGGKCSSRLRVISASEMPTVWGFPGCSDAT